MANFVRFGKAVLDVDQIHGYFDITRAEDDGKCICLLIDGQWRTLLEERETELFLAYAEKNLEIEDAGV